MNQPGPSEPGPSQLAPSGLSDVDSLKIIPFLMT